MEVRWFAGDEPEMIASVGILRWHDDAAGYVDFMVFPYDIKGKCERIVGRKPVRGQASRYDPKERRPKHSTGF